MNKKSNELYGLFTVFLLWYIIYFAVNSMSVPSPHVTLMNLMNIFDGESLILHVGYSLYRIIVSVGLALVVGSAIGITLGLNKRVDKVFLPGIYVLFPIPKAAFLPAIFAVFGLGDGSKIFLIFVIVVFQIIITTRDAVKNLSEEVFVSAMSIGMSKKDILRHIVVPSILPSIFSSVRVTVGIALAVLFFSETYATSYGIGYFIINKWSMIEYVDMYGGIVVLSFMGYLLFRVIDRCEGHYCKWNGGS